MLLIENKGFADVYYRVDDFADPWTAHDTVMLQHGFGRTGNMFHGWVPHLSREFRVVRPDLPGLGESPDPGPDVRFTPERLIASFVKLLDTLDVEKVHYVGESVGGLLGIAFAATHPERVKSLTLVSSIVRARPEKTGAINKVGFATWPEAVQTLGMKEWWLRSRKATGELTGIAAKDEWFANESGRTATHVGKIFTEFAPTVNAAPLLPQVKAPTLILSPGGSVHTDPEEQQAIRDGIAGSRQIVYPDGKHIDCYLRPDRYALDTLAFLREVSGSVPAATR